MHSSSDIISDEIANLCAQIAKSPARIEENKIKINRILNRTQSLPIKDILETYYAKINHLSNAGAGMYEHVTDNSRIGIVTELIPERNERYDTAKFLTDERPATLVKDRKLEQKVPNVELYRSKPGYYVFSFASNVAITYDATASTPSILVQQSGRSYEAVYATGGFRLWKTPIHHADNLLLIHDQFSPFNYCHWLLDWLPRLLLIRSAGVNLSDFKIAIYRPREFHYEALEILGITRSQIIALKDANDFAASSVSCNNFYSTSLTNSSWRHALHAGGEWAVALLKQHYLSTSKPTNPKRIVLNRIGTRGLIFDAATEKLLKDNGFTTVFTENLSFAKQIELFSSSECVIGAHGAGLANTVFCPPGAKILEIFPQGYSTGAYWLVSNAARLNYSCAVGTRGSSEPMGHVRDYDIAIPFEIVSRWINAPNEVSNAENASTNLNGERKGK